MFLECGVKVCVDGVPAAVDVYGVGCRRWLGQFHQRGRCGWLCGWAASGHLRRVRVGGGEDTAYESAELVRVDGGLT